MLRLLDIFIAFVTWFFPIAFPHHVMVAWPHAAPANANNTEPEDEDTINQNWYTSSWGLISRDGKLLSHLREPSHDASDDPVYFAPTFQEVLEYLPLCAGFESVFVRKMGRLYAQRPIYYAIGGDRVIYNNSFAAEHAWLKQPDRFANILATMSPSTALEHAMICAPNATHPHPYIIASS
ncbi:hypothetical protein K438DRAFT_1759327 [Mycena galopus ATCC 62051]|nr:hypothetical protein K438DRAFT_1759327 [Mycena galopus ATCC 62051]